MPGSNSAQLPARSSIALGLWVWPSRQTQAGLVDCLQPFQVLLSPTELFTYLATHLLTEDEKT